MQRTAFVVCYNSRIPAGIAKSKPDMACSASQKGLIRRQPATLEQRPPPKHPPRPPLRLRIWWPSPTPTKSFIILWQFCGGIFLDFVWDLGICISNIRTLA